MPSLSKLSEQLCHYNNVLFDCWICPLKTTMGFFGESISNLLGPGHWRADAPFKWDLT